MCCYCCLQFSHSRFLNMMIKESVLGSSFISIYLRSQSSATATLTRSEFLAFGFYSCWIDQINLSMSSLVGGQGSCLKSFNAAPELSLECERFVQTVLVTKILNSPTQDVEND